MELLKSYLESIEIRYKIGDFLTYFLLAVSVILIVGFFGIILAIIFLGGYEKVTWEFLTQAPEHGMTEGGVFPAIIGTVLLVIVTTIFSVPLGVITAIYLVEYGNKESAFYKFVNGSINLLASIPTIVIGMFGLAFFVVYIGGMIDNTFYGGNLTWGKPALIWAGLTMGLVSLPVVVASVREALEAVPENLKEASFALGATKMETVLKVILPRAFTGVLTGTILGVSRSTGEVAPVLFTGAAYFLPYLPSSLTDQFMELGYHIYVMATQSVDVDATLPIQFATTLVLLAITFILNVLAIIVRRRLRRELYV
jgi:phosphate transport system permease protein